MPLWNFTPLRRWKVQVSPSVRHRPVGRQLRQDLEVVVDVDQAVVDGEGVIGVVAGVHVGGIHRLLLAAPLVAEYLHAFVARGGHR